MICVLKNIKKKITIKSGFSVWYSKLKKIRILSIGRYKMCSGKIEVSPQLYTAQTHILANTHCNIFFFFCKCFALSAPLNNGSLVKKSPRKPVNELPTLIQLREVKRYSIYRTTYAVLFDISSYTLFFYQTRISTISSISILTCLR